MKNKCFILFILLCLLYIFRNPIMNLLLILDGTRNSGYIPKTSNIFEFVVTQIDDGSGMYWRYGKDDKFYYFFSLWEEDVYFYISKDNSCANFNEKDINTWCNAIKVKQK